MGTGYNVKFGNTSDSNNTPRFTQVKFEGSVKVNGETRDVSRRVYQRNDIDFEYIDPKTGKTNFQLMKSGRPPIGNDGKPIELHHILQKESGQWWNYAKRHIENIITNYMDCVEKVIALEMILL